MPFIFQESEFIKDWVSPISNDAQRQRWLGILEHGKTILRSKRCPYCAFSGMSTWYSNWSGLPEPTGHFDSEDHSWLLIVCPSCSWYAYTWTVVETDLYCCNSATISAFAQSGEVNQLPIDQLIQHLARKWNDRTEITAAQAEDLVAHIFSEHQDCEVHYVTNGVYTPDGGIDFVLVENSSGLSTAFQIKRKLNGKSESVANVKEFLGSLLLSEYSSGCYVTFADSFSTSCEEQIVRKGGDRLAAKGLVVDLVDGKQLQSILRNHKRSHLNEHPLFTSQAKLSNSSWHEVPIDQAEFTMWGYKGTTGPSIEFSEIPRWIWRDAS